MKDAWVTFCISTYKRPEFLHQQLLLLSKQTFKRFEVVVSDNDTEASARAVTESFDDSRFHYYHNVVNLGMISSFNKSIERASTEYIVLVTDDDPIDPEFLEEMYALYISNPGYSAYCGFLRTTTEKGGIEKILKDDFLPEVLNTKRTLNQLWSSAVIDRKDALKIGMIPDYGSPHLADHAFIALVGSVEGVVIVNKMYSHLTSHNSNFSKFNFDYYITGCKGFYSILTHAVKTRPDWRKCEKVIAQHLGTWLITNMYSLKKYFTVNQKDDQMQKQINYCAEKILALPFMRSFRLMYRVKGYVFNIKKIAGVLK